MARWTNPQRMQSLHIADVDTINQKYASTHDTIEFICNLCVDLVSTYIFSRSLFVISKCESNPFCVHVKAAHTRRPPPISYSDTQCIE